MSVYDVKFVSEQRLKSYTAIDENVRVKDITPFILNAQDIYIQPLIGTKMYKHLKDQIINNTLSNNEEVLVDDYIAKATMYYSLYLMLPTLKYKIVDKGVLNGASEDTTATTLEELKYLRQSTLDTAEFFAKRLVEFLKDNPGMFPQYENPGVKGLMPNKNTPYFSGLVTQIPSRKYKNYDCDDCNPLKGPSTLDT